MAIVAQRPSPPALSKAWSPSATLPAPEADARRHGEQVLARIIEEIGRAGGWISFARYMELALHEPGLGYYAAGAARFGEEGDFVTAPEMTPLFGATLATQVAEALAQPGDDLLELGAGSGRLAADLLTALRDRDTLPARYRILEISPDLAQRQRDTLRARVPALIDRIEWVQALPERFDGVVLANEVLDALPVHVVAWRPEGPHERGVALVEGALAWSERPVAPGPLRQAAMAIDVPMPYVSEISLAVPALVRALAAGLRRGVLLFIDYGFGRREYYHPQRSEGTLMCHYRHRAHANPFFLPGLQDVTAHVDFTAVAEAGIGAGMRLVGYTNQAHFLVNAGLLGLLEQREHQNPQSSGGSNLPALAAIQKLLSPAEMGELFKVIALAKGEVPGLSGFAGGDLKRTL
jgi:SAM-dependent MidA family methyltransferase